MNRPRVLHILTRLGMGASARQVIELSRRMLDSFDIAIASGPEDEGEGSLHRDAIGARIPVWTIPSLRRRGYLLSDRRALRELTAMIGSLGPSIVHTHQAKAGVLGRMAARKAGVRCLVHTFHEPLERPARDGLLRKANVAAEKQLAGSTDRLIAVSKSIKSDLAEHGVAPWERIEVIPPLVDPQRLTSGARFSDMRRRFGLDPGAPIVGLFGRLAPPKDPGLFIRVFATIAASIPQARALVVGDGPERPAMERSARKLGIVDRVVFTGWTADMAGAYAAIDLLMLTSQAEGYALTALEAMATGTPVVATRIAGVEEVVDDGRTGLLADPGDAAGLAGAAILVLRDEKFRARLAEAGREEAAGRFASSASASRLEALYREALALPLTRRSARSRSALRASAG